MEKDDFLVALTRLQSTQEDILRRFDEQRQMHEKLVDRMDTMESMIKYAAGALAVGSVMVFFALDWIKAKMGIGGA